MPTSLRIASTCAIIYFGLWAYVSSMTLPRRRNVQSLVDNVHVALIIVLGASLSFYVWFDL